MKLKCLLLFLVMSMTVSFAACGENADDTSRDKDNKSVSSSKADDSEKDKGEDKKDDENLIVIGDYEALYKGSKIVKGSNDEDAIAITFDYTNNGEEEQSFSWAFFTEIKQADTPLEYSVVFVSEDSYDTLDESYSESVQPGETKEITITYKLNDLTTPVVLEFSDLLDEETDTLTIDPTTL